VKRFTLTASQKSAAGVVVATGDEGPNGKGAASSQRDSMSDKRQKNQLQMVLAFAVEGRSEAPKARREGTEPLTAKRGSKSRARAERVMEAVCERENCLRP